MTHPMRDMRQERINKADLDLANLTAHRKRCAKSRNRALWFLAIFAPAYILAVAAAYSFMTYHVLIFLRGVLS